MTTRVSHVSSLIRHCACRLIRLKCAISVKLLGHALIMQPPKLLNVHLIQFTLAKNLMILLLFGFQVGQRVDMELMVSKPMWIDPIILLIEIAFDIDLAYWLQVI